MFVKLGQTLVSKHQMFLTFVTSKCFTKIATKLSIQSFGKTQGPFQCIIFLKKNKNAINYNCFCAKFCK